MAQGPNLWTQFENLSAGIVYILTVCYIFNSFGRDQEHHETFWAQLIIYRGNIGNFQSSWGPKFWTTGLCFMFFVPREVNKKIHVAHLFFFHERFSFANQSRIRVKKKIDYDPAAFGKAPKWIQQKYVPVGNENFSSKKSKQVRLTVKRSKYAGHCVIRTLSGATTSQQLF